MAIPESLEDLLIQKVKLEKEIAKLVSDKNPIRFSYKKFVADLGEYYFYRECNHLFVPSSLLQSTKSNAPADFVGQLIESIARQIRVDENVRIEIKTR
ncbi:hypothetical protein [Spirosoma areae]